MQASYPMHCARVLQTQAFHYTYGGSIYASKASQSERAVPSGHGMPLQWPDRPPVAQEERHLPRYILWLGAKGYQGIPEPVHSQRISCSASVLPFLAFSIFINIFIISFDEADILS